MNTHSLRLLVISLSLVSTQSQADDIVDFSLEELLNVEISSASKYKQSIRSAPSAVKVITAQDIKRYGWRNLDQALATLPGMTYSNDGSYSYLGTRGLSIPGDYNTRVLLLVDGIPFNDALYGQATVDNSFPIDLSLIDKIEYVPGPGSAIYGAHAMLGVINVITKNAYSTDHQGELVVDTDSEHRSTVRASYLNNFDNGVALLLSAKQMRRSGQDRYYPELVYNEVIDANGDITDGQIHNRDKTEEKELFAKLSFKNLTFSFAYGDRKSEPSNPLYWGIPNDDLLNHDKYTSLSASYDKQVNDTLNWYSSINYQNTQYYGDFPYNYEDGNGRTVNRDETESSRWIAESRLTTNAWQNHTVLAGLEFRQDSKAEMTNFDVGSPNWVYFDTDEKEHSIAFYAQDEWQFSQNWRLHSGARIDNSKVYGSHISPRVALIWDTSPTLTLKMMTGIAYRSPIQYEHNYGISPSDQDPAAGEEYLNNHAIDNESILTHELVAHWQPNDNFEWVNSFYYYDLRDLISQEFLGDDLQYQNSSEIESYGLESSINYHFDNKWQLTANLNIQSSANEESGQRIAVSPVWNAKILLNGPLWDDKLLLAWETHATDSYYQDWYGDRYEFASTVVSNMSLTALTPVRGLDLQLRVDNIFDRDFDLVGSADSPMVRIPDTGINARLTIRYSY